MSAFRVVRDTIFEPPRVATPRSIDMILKLSKQMIRLCARRDADYQNPNTNRKIINIFENLENISHRPSSKMVSNNIPYYTDKPGNTICLHIRLLFSLIATTTKTSFFTTGRSTSKTTKKAKFYHFFGNALNFKTSIYVIKQLKTNSSR